jgi:hypothetical protein
MLECLTKERSRTREATDGIASDFSSASLGQSGLHGGVANQSPIHSANASLLHRVSAKPKKITGRAWTGRSAHNSKQRTASRIRASAAGTGTGPGPLCPPAAGRRPPVQGPSTEHLGSAGRSTFRPPSSLVLLLTGPATTPAGFLDFSSLARPSPLSSLSFTLNQPARGRSAAFGDAIPTLAHLRISPSPPPPGLLPFESSRANLPNFCCL